MTTGTVMIVRIRLKRIQFQTRADVEHEEEGGRKESVEMRVKYVV